MASDLLHIKDSYYFEVPKFLWGSERTSMDEFPDFWIRLDDQYQAWEADQLAHRLEDLIPEAPGAHDLVRQWEHWQHADHANHGRPLDVFLEMQHDQLHGRFRTWKAADPDRADREFVDYLNQTEPEFDWFAVAYAANPKFQRQWREAKEEAENVAKFRDTQSWSEAKLDGYNAALAGKILIPQPFGQLRNLYQRESGFCISKFMILEVTAALIAVMVFSWLARRMQSSERPRGRLWNLLEAMLLFIRDEVARPAIGGHDHDEEHGEHGHGEHDDDDQEEFGSPGEQLGAGLDHGGPHAALEAAGVHPGHLQNEADRFVPLLWTIFFFILGLNLFGMLPWAGAPSASLAVTSAMALVTFGTVTLAGMKQFGPLGFFGNQVPSMDLPLPLALIIKPMVFLIELLGLMIKHGVLAVRLLANMVAGHLVLLALMGLAFGAHAAHQFQGEASAMWGVTATAAVLGSTLFSCLELFVAFLQAYIFTLLSALFIGAGVHKH